LILGPKAKISASMFAGMPVMPRSRASTMAQLRRGRKLPAHGARAAAGDAGGWLHAHFLAEAGRWGVRSEVPASPIGRRMAAETLPARSLSRLWTSCRRALDAKKR